MHRSNDRPKDVASPQERRQSLPESSSSRSRPIIPKDVASPQSWPESSIEVAEWPPVWKAVGESPQYSSRMIQSYLPEWELEHCDDLEDSFFPPTSFGTVMKDAHKKLKIFLQQVRTSRGYDVDVRPPAFMNSPFFPVPLDRVTDREIPSRVMNAKITFIMSEINAQARIHGEEYEFVKLEKVVEASLSRLTLVTFTVIQLAPNRDVEKTVQAMVYTKAFYNQELRVYLPEHYTFELKEWRFKPAQ